MVILRYLLLVVLLLNFTCSPGKLPASDTLHTKSNIISVVQFQFTENGIGFGSSYERRLDCGGYFAFYIPVMVTFNIANSNRIYDYNTGNFNTGKADAMFYTMPGFKYYPAGDRGKIRYATGGSVVIGDGKRSGYVANINGLNETEQITPHFLSGLMWQNSLNAFITPRLYVGLEFGIGGTLQNRSAGNPIPNEVLVHGSFKIGFAF
jgi:hypothetical protein